MTRRPLLLIAVLSIVVQLVGLYRPAGFGGGEGIPGLDKVAHVGIFFLPVFFLLLAGCRRWWVVLVFALHAPLSELVQQFLLPRRTADPYDLIADALGIILAAVLATVIISRRQRSAVATDQVTTADPDGTPRSEVDQKASSGRSINSRSTP